MVKNLKIWKLDIVVFLSEPLLPSKVFVLTGKNLLRIHSCTGLTEPLWVIFGYVQFVMACAKS